MSSLPNQDSVQLQMDCIPELRTVSGTLTAQAGKNAASDQVALSAAILQVSRHHNCFLIRYYIMQLAWFLG